METLAELTLNNGLLEKLGFALGGYLCAALGWGIRVEIKLRELSIEQRASKVTAEALRDDVKSLVRFESDARVHMGRVDEKLDQIYRTLKTGLEK